MESFIFVPSSLKEWSSQTDEVQLKERFYNALKLEGYIPVTTKRFTAVLERKCFITGCDGTAGDFTKDGELYSACAHCHSVVTVNTVFSGSKGRELTLEAAVERHAKESLVALIKLAPPTMLQHLFWLTQTAVSYWRISGKYQPLSIAIDRIENRDIRWLTFNVLNHQESAEQLLKWLGSKI